MADNLVFFGDTYTIPDTGEYDWGVQVNGYLQAIDTHLDGTFQSVTAAGASTTINFSNGKNVDLSLNANTTLTLSNPRSGRPAVLWVVADAARTITWPAAVKWPGGTAPTFGAAGTYIVTLLWNSTRAIYAGEYGSASYS